MNNIIKVIVIPESDRDAVQKNAIEVESRANLIKFMLENDMDTKNPDKFKTYHDDYEKFYKEFDASKNMIQKKYVDQFMEDGKTYSWNLDYDTCELTITCIE